MSAKRITYAKVTGQHEWADARFDVFLDGVKIGQVVKFEESGGRHAGGVRYYTSTWTKMVWEFEGGTYANGRPYRQIMASNTRVDAVVDYLTRGVPNLGYGEARDAAGKRGMY